MYKLNPSTHKWDYPLLPEAIRLALLNHPPNSNLIRLTESFFGFRRISGSGVWEIGTIEELLPLILSLPVPPPYVPRGLPSAKSDPLDLSGLIITLDL